MKKASLKTLAVLLALCMVVAMVPVTALAASLEDAGLTSFTVGGQSINSLEGGGTSESDPYKATVTLESSVSLDSVAVEMVVSEGTAATANWEVQDTNTTVTAFTFTSTLENSDSQGKMTGNISGLTGKNQLAIKLDKTGETSSYTYFLITVLQKPKTLSISVDNKGTISGDEATNGGTSAYYLVDSSKATEIGQWTTQTKKSEVDTNLGVTKEGAKPTLTAGTHNGKVLVVVEFTSGADDNVTVLAAGESSQIAILPKLTGLTVDAVSVETVTSVEPANSTPGTALAATLAAHGENFKITATFNDETEKVKAYYTTEVGSAGTSGTELKSGTQSTDISISGDTADVYIWLAAGDVKGYYKLTVTNPKAPVETVTPSLETSTSIECGEDNVVINLTSDKNFSSSLSADSFDISGDIGLNFSSANGTGTSATLTLSGTAKPGTLTIKAKKAAFETQEGLAEESESVTIEIAEPTISASPSSIDTNASNPKITVTISNGKFANDTGTVDSVTATGVAGLSFESANYTSVTTIDVTLTGTATETGTISISIPAAAIKGLDSAKTATVTVTAPAPVTPPTPSTTVTQPSTDAEGGTTTVDVNTRSTTSGTTARATVSNSSMSSAVNSALSAAEKAGTDPVVEVKVSTSRNADTLNVTLPAASLEKLAEAEDASLVITSDIAEVALDNTALTALTEGAAGTTVTLEVTPQETTELSEAQANAVGKAPVVDVSLLSGGTAIHDYKNGIVKVTLPYTLAEGQGEDDVVVYYLGDDGSLTPCDTVFAGGKVTFTTVHLSKYVIGDGELGQEKDCPSLKLSDLDNTAWYHEYTDYVLKADLMHGHDDGSFKPADAVTRAEMVTVLWNLAEDPVVNFIIPFTDVKEGEWYAEAIRWAASEGIVDGYDDGTFKPDQAVTREELAVMLCRYEKKVNDSYTAPAATALEEYPDAAGVSVWAAEAMAWCVENKIVTGDDGRLDPAGEALREQLAAILTRYDKLAK